MQAFNETFRYTDPLLHPREKTPDQKIFLAWLSGGEEAEQRERDRQYPKETTSPESNSPASPNPADLVAK